MSVQVKQPAPDFTATAVKADKSFNDSFTLSDLKGKYAVLFFYPLNFTFVCPSEIIAFDKKVAAFQERNCKLIGFSVDSHFSHLAWEKTPVNKGGIGNIQFPLVADLTKQIARDYGIVFNNAISLRGLFLIDRDGIVQHALVNNLPLGRNVDEAIHVLDALQRTQE